MATLIIGKQVARLRQERGLSQRKLARSVGLSPGAINMIESNQRNPTYDTLCLIAQGLNIAVSELVSEPTQRQKAATTGELIRQTREAQGMSQRKLAAKAEVSQTLISFLESGTRVDASGNCLHRVATALGISITDLIETTQPQEAAALAS